MLAEKTVWKMYDEAIATKERLKNEVTYDPNAYDADVEIRILSRILQIDLATKNDEG